MKKIEELKRLLIVVDMVNGFIKEGAMADSSINNITPNIVNTIGEFMSKMDAQVAFIKDTHELGCQEFKRYPVHCVKGTSEAELIDELIRFEKDSLVYEKNSTSTMFAPNFMNDINSMRKLREIIVIGCCTDICVMNLVIPMINYFDQMNRDIKIIVPTNMVETYDAPFHKRDEWNNLAYAAMKQAGAEIVHQYRLER